MKRKILSNLALISVGATLLAGCNSSRDDSPQPLLAISQVDIGKMQGDAAGAEYSMHIDFSYNGDVPITDWSIGMFLPRTLLESDVQGINTNQVLEVCELGNNQCQSLVVEQNRIDQIDKTQGYMSILKPESKFTLEQGKQYQIRILHNNQWAPDNLSAVPQSIFLMDYVNGRAAKPTVYQLPTQVSTYNLLDYNQSAVDADIQKHISDNWTNSIPLAASEYSRNLGLIPTPKSVSDLNVQAPYTLEGNVFIYDNWGSRAPTNQHVRDVLNLFSGYLDNDLDTNTTIMTGAGQGITVIEDDTIENPEGYDIRVTTNGIEIRAKTQAGVYYAFQSLRQLWNQSPSIPTVTIQDAPRFKYRGVLLDDSRHTFTVAEVKKLIDTMGAHKINTLHMHLADDEGYRLGDNQTPYLTAIGGLRQLGILIGPTMLNQGSLSIIDTKNIPSPVSTTLYGGAYTEAQIQELKEYANLNQITLIAEIDLPGHSRAMIKSNLSAFVDPNDESQFISVQGYTDDVIPVCTYDSTISLGPDFTSAINQIVQHAANLFDGQTTVYAIDKEVSVGGDEVSAQAWTNDASCRTPLQPDNTWEDMSALEKSQYFFKLMSEYNQGGTDNTELTFSGWQQFIQSDEEALGNERVSAAQTGHVWVWNQAVSPWGGVAGYKQAIELIKNNYPTVAAFSDDTYLDLRYNPDYREPGLYWATPYGDTHAALHSAIDVNKVLNDSSLTSQQKELLLGVEGTLWTEMIPNFRALQYMAFPKMAGLAEAGWAAENTTTDANNTRENWQSLASRLGCGQTGFLAYLNKRFGVEYRGYPNGISLEVPKGTCN